MKSNLNIRCGRSAHLNSRRLRAELFADSGGEEAGKRKFWTLKRNNKQIKNSNSNLIQNKLFFSSFPLAAVACNSGRRRRRDSAVYRQPSLRWFQGFHFVYYFISICFIFCLFDCISSFSRNSIAVSPFSRRLSQICICFKNSLSRMRMVLVDIYT